MPNMYIILLFIYTLKDKVDDGDDDDDFEIVI